jgi:hypothetical protein
LWQCTPHGSSKKDTAVNVNEGTTTSQTIDGATTFSLTTLYQASTVVSDGAIGLVV